MSSLYISLKYNPTYDQIYFINLFLLFCFWAFLFSSIGLLQWRHKTLEKWLECSNLQPLKFFGIYVLERCHFFWTHEKGPNAQKQEKPKRWKVACPKRLKHSFPFFKDAASLKPPNLFFLPLIISFFDVFGKNPD